VCSGRLLQNGTSVPVHTSTQQTVRLSCRANEWPDEGHTQGGVYGECAPVHWSTVSKLSGNAWDDQGGGGDEGAPVHWCSVSKQSGHVWEDQGGGCGECARVHGYTASTQPNP